VPHSRQVLEGSAPVRPTQRLAINENAVFIQLRSRGYEVIATNSGWEEYALRSADLFVDGGSMNDFELELLNSTFLGDLATRVHPDIGSSQVRDRIVTSLAVLSRIAAERVDHPRLVFAHIPAPHQPTVFGPAGEHVSTRLDSRFFRDTPAESDRSLDEFVVAYRGQVNHLNRLVMTAVREVLAAAQEPPVIVIMSDHGSASRVNWLAVSPQEAEPDDLRERRATLFAAYTPDRSGVFPDDVSTVNVFRHLSDAYFGTSLGEAERAVNGGGG
jgi:hypothetical protein